MPTDSARYGGIQTASFMKRIFGMYVAVGAGPAIMVSGGITGLATGAVGAPGGTALVQLETSSANTIVGRKLFTKRFTGYPGFGDLEL